MKNDNFWVYTHTTPDGLVYVGQSQFETTNLRWVKSHYRPTTTFRKEIEKWGWDNIKHEVVATNLTHEEALKLEGELIDFCKLNGVSLNIRHSGGKWLGTPKYYNYIKNKDRVLKRQRDLHWTKKWNKELKENGYISLF